MSYETRYAAWITQRNAEREASPEAVAWRRKDNVSRERAFREANAKFGPVTVTNLQERSDWFNARVRTLNGEG